MKFVVLDFGEVTREAERLSGVASAASHTAPAMEKIALDMLRVERALIDSQGRRGGGSWSRLKWETVEKKGSYEIIKTGAAKRGYSKIAGKPAAPNTLFDSLTVLGAPFQILHIANAVIDFGTDRPYAGTHQFGNTKRNIPRRPIIRFTANDIDRWRQLLYDHLLRPHKVK